MTFCLAILSTDFIQSAPEQRSTASALFEEHSLQVPSQSIHWNASFEYTNNIPSQSSTLTAAFATDTTTHLRNDAYAVLTEVVPSNYPMDVDTAYNRHSLSFPTNRRADIASTNQEGVVDVDAFGASTHSRMKPTIIVVDDEDDDDEVVEIPNPAGSSPRHSHNVPSVARVGGQNSASTSECTNAEGEQYRRRTFAIAIISLLWQRYLQPRTGDGNLPSVLRKLKPTDYWDGDAIREKNGLPPRSSS